MNQRYADILNDPLVCAELKRAWEDSNPGLIGGHEEGGFILKNSEGNFSIVRWVTGEQNKIFLPSHAGCKIKGVAIAASFHTHPNTGGDYLQEPSETDKRSVRDDPDLKEASYLGEFVISQAKIYWIEPSGQVSEVSDTSSILGLHNGD
jgi:Domain of unknown function (DUF4329)